LEFLQQRRTIFIILLFVYPFSKCNGNAPPLDYQNNDWGSEMLIDSLISVSSVDFLFENSLNCIRANWQNGKFTRRWFSFVSKPHFPYKPLCWVCKLRLDSRQLKGIWLRWGFKCTWMIL